MCMYLNMLTGGQNTSPQKTGWFKYTSQSSINNIFISNTKMDSDNQEIIFEKKKGTVIGIRIDKTGTKCMYM